MIQPGGEAIYRQVARGLEQRLDAEAEPGYVLPSVASLARELGLGADTVRAAIELLVNMGRLTPRQGYGAVVRTERQREVIAVPAGSVVSARMPTFAEQDRWELEPGVPMLVVGDQAWPADRFEIRVGDE